MSLSLLGAKLLLRQPEVSEGRNDASSAQVCQMRSWNFGVLGKTGRLPCQISRLPKMQFRLSRLGGRAQHDDGRGADAMSDHHRRSFCCRMVKARRRRIPQYFRVEDRRDDRLVSENRGRTSEMKTPIGKPELALVLMV